MSDAPPISLEDLARIDGRFNDIRLAIDLEAALREDQTLYRLMAALREDADRAMADFATANCGDVLAIQGLQSRVYRFRYTLEFFEGILQRGQVARREVELEERTERERYD